MDRNRERGISVSGVRCNRRCDDGKGCTVWYNAVVRGDMAPITIGEGSNIQDNAVVHVDNGFPSRDAAMALRSVMGRSFMAARWRMTVLSVWGRFS